MWPTIVGGLLSIGSGLLNKPKDIDVSGHLTDWKSRMGDLAGYGEDMIDFTGDMSNKVRSYLTNQATNAGSQIGNSVDRTLAKFGNYSGIATQKGAEAMQNSLGKVGGQFLDYFGKAKSQGLGLLQNVMGQERAYGETMANQQITNQSNQQDWLSGLLGSAGQFGQGMLTRGLENWLPKGKDS